MTYAQLVEVTEPEDRSHVDEALAIAAELVHVAGVEFYETAGANDPYGNFEESGCIN